MTFQAEQLETDLREDPFHEDVLSEGDGDGTGQDQEDRCYHHKIGREIDQFLLLA